MKTDYEARLSIPITGGQHQLFAVSGEHVATGYQRVVLGGRGPYVEFFGRHLNRDALLVTDTEHYYFDELRTKADNVMVYAQTRRVDYADYIVGRFYISPFELYDSAGKALIEPLRKQAAGTRSPGGAPPGVAGAPPDSR